MARGAGRDAEEGSAAVAGKAGTNVDGGFPATAEETFEPTGVAEGTARFDAFA